jgi:hypothetical protein
MESIAISYVESYGTRGTALGNFEYPRGLCIKDNLLAICDTQNDRVQVSDLAGNEYLFGTEMSFPDSIVYDGDRHAFFVTDSDNHCIREYDVTGTLLNTIGTNGTGEVEFEFPSGIAINDTHIFVADRQNNRIQKMLKSDFSFVSETGGFLLPEGVCLIDDSVYVMDSGNGILKQYDLDFNYLREVGGFLEGYGTRVENIGGVLCVVDNIDNNIYFFSKDLVYIRSYSQNMWFPEGVTINGDKMYVSMPHKINIYNIEIEFGLQFLQEFETLNQQLYPTGRAWWRVPGTVFSLFNEALSLSDSRLYSAIQNMQLGLIADNYNITDIDIERWESVYGIVSRGTRQERIDLINQRMSYPNNILARQSIGFIELQLNNAGFDVSLNYDPDYNPKGAIHDEFLFGTKVHGAIPETYTICANYIRESQDADFEIKNYYKKVFYVGGETLGTEADVPSARKNELRELILQLKPADTVAVLFINYL